MLHRPLLSEIQCLVNRRPEVSSSNTNSKAVPARRASDGFPLQRLQLLCAVIEKRLQLPLWNKDVYLNVVGGLRVSEPSADLAVAMSIVSSALEEPILHKTCFVGEIGNCPHIIFWVVTSILTFLIHRTRWRTARWKTTRRANPRGAEDGLPAHNCAQSGGLEQVQVPEHKLEVCHDEHCCH